MKRMDNKKNRVRLTVYVDKPLHDAFLIDADLEYRSMSDHMNAILSGYYGEIEPAVLSDITTPSGC